MSGGDRTVRRWLVRIRESPATLWLIVLLGLALRLAAARSFNSWNPDSAKILVGDEPGYDNTALELLAGQGYTWPGRVPLYPALLAALHWITGGSYHGIRYWQAVIGTAVVPLTYLLGRLAFGRAVGLVAAFLAATSYVLCYQPLHILSEVLFTPIMLAGAVALWRAFEVPSGGRFAWTGALLGVSALVRPTLLFAPAFLVLPIWLAIGPRWAVRGGLACMTGAALAIAPWMVRNYERYHAIFPLATSNAILWQGSPEYYHLIHDEGYTYLRVWTEIIYGPGWRTHDPTSVEGDKWWTRRALRSIASEPGTYLRYAGEKAVTYWVGDPAADWAGGPVLSYAAARRVGFQPVFAVLIIVARALPIVALVAVFVLRREWRRLLPIYGILVYVTLLHAATHAESRLSEPFQPLLLVLIIGAVVRVFPRLDADYEGPRSPDSAAHAERIARSRL